MEHAPGLVNPDTELREFVKNESLYRPGKCSFQPCPHQIVLHPIERFQSLIDECKVFLEKKVPLYGSEDSDQTIIKLQNSLSQFTCQLHRESIPRVFQNYWRFDPEKSAKEEKNFKEPCDWKLKEVRTLNMSSEPDEVESDEEESAHQPRPSSPGSVDEWIGSQSDEIDVRKQTTTLDEDKDASLAPPKAAASDATEAAPSTPIKNMIYSASSSPMSSARSETFDKNALVEANTPDTEEKPPLRPLPRPEFQPGQGNGSPRPRMKRNVIYKATDGSNSRREQDDDVGSTLSAKGDTQSSVRNEQDETRTESEIVPDEQEISIYNDGLTVCKDASTYLSALLQGFKKSVYNEGLIYVAFDEGEDSDVKGLVKVGYTKGDPVTRYKNDKCGRMSRSNITFLITTYNVKTFYGARLAEKGIRLELFRQRRKIINCHRCPLKSNDSCHSHVEWFEMPLKEVLTVVNRWQWIVQSLALDKDESIRSKLVDILQKILHPPDMMKDLARRLDWDAPPPDVTDDYMEKLMKNSFTLEQGKAKKKAGGFPFTRIPEDMYSNTQSFDFEKDRSGERLAMSKDETKSDHQVDNFDEQRRQFDMNLIYLIVAFAFLVALQLFQLSLSAEFSVSWGIRVGG